MLIRSKISVFILGFFLVIILATVILSRTIIYQNYEDLDANRATENSLRNISSIETILSNLSISNRDWSSWDETYYFVGDLNPEYIEFNLQTDTFINLGLSFMIFLGSSSDVVYSGAYDSGQPDQISDVDPALITHLISADTVLQDSIRDRTNLQGLHSFEDSIYLIVSNPILPNDGQGPANGALIWGRLFDLEAFNNSLSDVGSFTTIQDLANPALPDDFMEAVSFLSEHPDQPTYLEIRGADTISAYSLLNNFHGNTEYIIRSDSSRGVSAQGLVTINLYLLILGGVGLLLGAISYYFMGRFIVNPIIKLKTDTEMAGNKEPEDRQIHVTGKDEVSSLGHAINRTFQEINKYERSLSRSAQEWQTTFDSISDPVSILDKDFKIVRVNRAYSRAFNMETADLVGKHCYEIAHGTDKPIASCPYAKTLKSGQFATAVVFDLGKDKYTEVSTYPIFNTKREVVSTVHIAKDITERQKIQEQLKTVLAHQETILSTVPDIIMETDKNKVYTWANKTGLDFFGDDVIGKEASYYFDGEQETYNIVQPILTGENEDNIYVESWQRRQDGEKRLLAWWCRSLKDGNGVVSGALSAATDITERFVSEIKNKQLSNKAEMSSRLAAVGEMAAGIAHEINNPLTGVIGFSELLQDRKDLPPDVMENLKIINDGSIRVKDIVRRMLTFARQATPQKSSTSITELIDNTLELRSYVLRTSNIEVVREYDPDLPWVVVDPGQLQQVFLNIIVNAEFAMKKAHDKGVLTIKTKTQDNHIQVSISDNGPGMSDKTKDKIFQPFFTTKEPGEGTGLGLALSFGIIQEHGGTITVESVLGQGTTFIVELPITKPEGEEPESEVPVVNAKPKKVAKAKILVVDDEPTVRALIKSILGAVGHTVEETDNPQVFLEKLATTTYDLLLMDMRMPGMSGMELYDEISKRWPQQAKRIIFITGDTSDVLIREFLSTHEIPYIAKPFDQKTLEGKVNEVLSRL